MEKVAASAREGELHRSGVSKSLLTQSKSFSLTEASKQYKFHNAIHFQKKERREILLKHILRGINKR